MSSPEKILVIRHGEKPPQRGGPPHGVTIDGKRDDGSLTPRGWQRAGALVHFFKKPSKDLDAPSTIYAARPKEAGGSSRPFETVQPCAAQFTKGRIRASFHRSAIQGMIRDVLKQSGIVLVCWDHEHIPRIAQEILGSGADVPRWSGARFDMVWAFTRHNKGYRLSIVMQKLLPGDLH